METDIKRRHGGAGQPIPKLPNVPLQSPDVHLDTLSSGTPAWVYAAVKGGKTVINRAGLADFLNIFEATLGFLRLTIYGVKRYFFVYIAKGLEPRDIKYLSFFFDASTLITMNIAMTRL